MTLVSKLNGSFSLSDLERLKFPVAWSGTVPKSDQETEEAALRALANKAARQFQEAYDYWDISEGKELEIRIVDGEITEIVEV